MILAHVEPFGVLVEHRVDDVHESLVGVEQAVSAGQCVTLEPSQARVLGEHLHDTAVGRKLATVLVFGPIRRKPRLLGHLKDGAEPV